MTNLKKLNFGGKTWELITDFGIQGVAMGVTITNLTKEYRYYSEPYFVPNVSSN